MSRILSIFTIAAVAMVLTSPIWADEPEEEQTVINQVKETWRKIAAKEVDDIGVGPSGIIQAQSHGGFWRFFTPETMAAYLKDSPNLRFTPYYIEVRFLGSKKDVAYVTYYLAGTIVRQGKEDIANYRTRASSVMEKIDGIWVTAGSHYSPLFGGTGIEAR